MASRRITDPALAAGAACGAALAAAFAGGGLSGVALLLDNIPTRRLSTRCSFKKSTLDNGVDNGQLFARLKRFHHKFIQRTPLG
jgi:hypothetical protein